MRLCYGDSVSSMASQHFPHRMEQLLRGEWLRENVNILKCVPVAESSIVNQTADHQDRQARTLGPEKKK